MKKDKTKKRISITGLDMALMVNLTINHLNAPSFDATLKMLVRLIPAQSHVFAAYFNLQTRFF